MHVKKIYTGYLYAGLLMLLFQSVYAQSADLVNGNLIQFNDNGAWCWYQDERAAIDREGGKLIVGCNASGYGTGGSPRNGDIEAVIYDLPGGGLNRYTLKEEGINHGGCDDHNAPAFLILPDGNYLSMYAGHNNDYKSYYRVFDGFFWGMEQHFNWQYIPGGTDYTSTYSNLVYLEDEQRLYNFVRNYRRSPNMMISGDGGRTWIYGGLLTQPAESIGYVNGYFKYAGNGKDRIDFTGTEHHPRDFNTSIYHGYIRNGHSYNAKGVEIDKNITDKNAPRIADFTKVFSANTVVNGHRMTRAWTIELESYPEGICAMLFKTRADDNEMDHRFFYARYDGENWEYHYLCKAGAKMYYSEEDYIGLGAIDPADPGIIYLSTPVDPRDDTTDLGSREIFKGVTKDEGQSWSWSPLTSHSSRDNFRPIVPAWDGEHTALLWCRGTYISAQAFDAAVVGILEGPGFHSGLQTYVDATLENTTLATGYPLMVTGPSDSRGPADDIWHLRSGAGNGDSVFTSSEYEGENAPTLCTRKTIPRAGTYDVWINFWGKSAADWRIRAGLSYFDLRIFRSMASQQVAPGGHTSAIVLTEGNDVSLYQAYLGRVTLEAGAPLAVYANDESIRTGSSYARTGDTTRTWYDGFSYALASNNSPEPPLRGDVNGDNQVNIIDSHQIARYSVGLAVPDFLISAADVNCDGNITIIDALQIVQYSIGILNAFPC